MFIRAVDDGLERLLRARLPLPEDVGDVSFDPPTGTWAAQLARLTINLFLFDIDRSQHPNRANTHRTDANGRAERRLPQPMVSLSYLVSAWAGNPRDEHQLLGDLVSIVAGLDGIPTEYVTLAVNSQLYLQFGADDANRLREIWGGIGGQLKASCVLRVSVATDTHDWTDEAPAVQRIQVLTTPHSRQFTR
jgi:hypothetical protein